MSLAFEGFEIVRLAQELHGNSVGTVTGGVTTFIIVVLFNLGMVIRVFQIIVANSIVVFTFEPIEVFPEINQILL